MGRLKQFNPDVTLDVAVDTFWQQGFEGTPVQDLCRAMGLNPGSLYGTYGDKRALFLAALDRYIETVSRQAIERIGRETSGMTAIRAYFAHLIDAIVDGKRRWGCLITNSAVELGARDPAIKAKVALHFARLETAFGSALARAQAAGELADSVGVDAAGFLVCVVQGVNVLAKTKPTRQQLEHVVEMALRALTANLPSPCR